MSDADLRLAELTAGLVAAGDIHTRQADTIRRLTDEQQRSHRRDRSHREKRPTSSRSRRDRVSDPEPRRRRTRDEVDHQPRRRSHGDAYDRDIRDDYHERDNRFVLDEDDDRFSSSSAHRATRPSSTRQSRRDDLDHVDDGYARSPSPEPSRSTRTARRTTRHIHFSPASTRTKRPSTFSAPVEPTRSHPAHNPDFVEMARLREELSRLRSEREEWSVQRQQKESEAAAYSSLLADLNRNTQRLLQERSNHLNAISRLQDDLSRRPDEKEEEERHHTSPIAQRSPLSHSHSPPRRDYGRPLSPIPPSAPPSAPASPPMASASKRSPSCTVTLPPLPRQRSPRAPVEESRTAVPLGSDASSERGAIVVNETQELQTELRLVLEENARLSEQIPALEARYREMSDKWQDAQVRLQEQAQEPPPVSSANFAHGIEAAQGRSPVLQMDDVARLVEEIDILESVSDAIHFGTGRPSGASPNVTGAIDVTSTGLDTTTVGNVARRRRSGREEQARNDNGVADAVERLGRIRASLSLKYGQWLEALANQSLTCGGGDDAATATLSSTGAMSETDDVNRAPIDIQRLIDEA